MDIFVWGSWGVWRDRLEVGGIGENRIKDGNQRIGENSIGWIKGKIRGLEKTGWDGLRVEIRGSKKLDGMD